MKCPDGWVPCKDQSHTFLGWESIMHNAATHTMYWCSFQTYTIMEVPNGTKPKPSRLSESASLQTAEVEHHRGEKKRTKWQGRSYFPGFFREKMQAISFSVKHETRRASSSLTRFHSGFISLAHANLLVSDHVGFAWDVESCHSSNGYGVKKKPQR